MQQQQIEFLFFFPFFTFVFERYKYLQLGCNKKGDHSSLVGLSFESYNHVRRCPLKIKFFHHCFLFGKIFVKNHLRVDNVRERERERLYILLFNDCHRACASARTAEYK
jgi:hypothetical protein